MEPLIFNQYDEVDVYVISSKKEIFFLLTLKHIIFGKI